MTTEHIVAQSLSELTSDARRALAQIEDGTCCCPDEPHQNLLHDLAADLAALDDTHDGQANTCPHGSATGVDRSPIGPGKVWRCDHCGLRWTDSATEEEGA